MSKFQVKVFLWWAVIWTVDYTSLTGMFDSIAYVGLMLVIPVFTAFVVAAPMVWVSLVIIGSLMAVFGVAPYRWIGLGLLAIGLFSWWVQGVLEKQSGGFAGERNDINDTQGRY